MRYAENHQHIHENIDDIEIQVQSCKNIFFRADRVFVFTS